MPCSENSGTLRCPACGDEHDVNAVFCGNPGCRKALGEFRFVSEEIAASTSRLERLADQVARFTSHPHFVTLHVTWFGVWVALNSGLVATVAAFDTFPYSLLGLLLGIEAILITGFLLISQNRQTNYAEQRAELDYEVNVRSYRKLRQIEERLDLLAKRLDPDQHPASNADSLL